MPPPKKSKIASGFGLAVTLAVKLFKGGKVIKLMLAAASLGAYAYLWSWPFALTLLGALFVHELGHVWAMKREGVPHSGVHFIPFVGAVIVPEKDFPSRKAEAFIGIMGPVWGGGLAYATYLVYLETQSPLIAAIAGWMASLNLFNLFPVSPLDGGRVMKSIAFSVSGRLGFVMMVLCLVGVCVLAWQMKFMLFVVILPLGFLEILGERFETKRRRQFEEARLRSVAWFAKELGVPETPKAVTECLEDGYSLIMTIPLDWNIDHPVWRMIMSKSRLISHTHFPNESLRERNVKDFWFLCKSGLIDHVFPWKTAREEGSEMNYRVRSYIQSFDDVRVFLQGEKRTMSRKQIAIGTVSYIGLLILLGALLLLTQHVEGAKHALEIFQS